MDTYIKMLTVMFKFISANKTLTINITGNTQVKENRN